MLPLENDVADYVEETGNHVLFRATPIFNDDELIARGVQLEALSSKTAERACVSTNTATTCSRM